MNGIDLNVHLVMLDAVTENLFFFLVYISDRSIFNNSKVDVTLLSAPQIHPHKSAKMCHAR